MNQLRDNRDERGEEWLKEYKKYIDDHVKHVTIAYNNLISNEWINNPRNVEFKKVLKELREKIKNHDASKYSDEEFEAYRAKFYPVDRENQDYVDENFEEAMKHHYANNDHHPEHWIDENGNPTDMPLICILELICDWEAMSKVGDSSADFWKKTKETRWKNIMTAKTIDTIDKLMKVLYYKD